MARARSPSLIGRQRGAMSVTMLLLMIGLVTMLGLVEIGYLYWAKRDAQKVADLSAIAGAQRLDLCNASYSSNEAARINAMDENAFPGQLQIHCGNWNAAHAAADHFVQGASEGNPLNAVRVIASRSVIPFFGQNASLPTVSAQAVAKRSAPMAVFSVGSQLLRVEGDAPLGSVLKLVGVDLDSTALLDYNGLTNVSITPAGLLHALKIDVKADMTIADFNQLLAINEVTLGRLLEATATVIGRDGFASAELRLLQKLQGDLGAKVDLGSLMIKLGSNTQGGGLFAEIISPDPSADNALQANVNVLDLLTAGISVAADGNAIKADNVGLEGLRVTAGLIEPASIAIGGVGARAYNAQVRLFADIDTNKLPALGGLLGALQTRLQLPLYVDATNAMGTLTELQCSTSPATATIKVESSVLRACVGRVNEADRFSKANVCEDGLQNERLLTLLGIPLVTTQLNVNALKEEQTVTLQAGETVSTRVNQLQLGDTVAELVGKLLGVLSGILTPGDTSNSPSKTADALAERFFTAANPGSGPYNVDRTINLLEHGSENLGIEGLGTWNIEKGVPHPCALLITCYEDGTVWESYRASVTGEGNGLLGGVLNLLGITNCNGLINALLRYNDCLKTNLSAYLQTAPADLLESNGTTVTIPPTGGGCTGLLCAALKPVIDLALNLLKPILNGIGDLLSNLLTNLLGLELGRTDVHVQSIQCGGAQLVY